MMITAPSAGIRCRKPGSCPVDISFTSKSLPQHPSHPLSSVNTCHVCDPLPPGYCRLPAISDTFSFTDLTDPDGNQRSWMPVVPFGSSSSFDLWPGRRTLILLVRLLTELTGVVMELFLVPACGRGWLKMCHAPLAESVCGIRNRRKWWR